jgi:hypothetical protein
MSAPVLQHGSMCAMMQSAYQNRCCENPDDSGLHLSGFRLSDGGFRLFRRLCEVGLKQDLSAQEIKAGTTIHLTLDELKAVDMPLGPTVAPG